MTKIYFDNKGRLNDVAIIRSLAILMVVAFHAYYMMMVPGHFPASKDMYYDMYFNLNCMILQFRMPLFIMISGYLFSHLENDRGKYATFKELLTNKFKRLIIPFFVFATFFMLIVNNFLWETYLSWGYQHLWFITMLFWCFLFTRLQSFLPFSKTTWWKVLLLTIFFIFNIYLNIKIPLLGVQYFLRWYFWFYLGYQLYLNRNKVFSIISHKPLLWTTALAIIFCGGVWAKCTFLHGDDSTHTWYTELANFSICITIWYWVNMLIIKYYNGTSIKTIEWLNRHSYGIYVFHNMIQPFMISSTAISLFGLEVLAMYHPIIFPLVFFISSFILSLGITWLLLKTRIGRFLIG